MTQKDARFAPREPDSAHSNLPLLLIASAFLCVTVVLALLQPRLNTPTPEITTQDVDGTEHAPTTTLRPQARQTTEPLAVTRTQTPLLTRTVQPSTRAFPSFSTMIKAHLRQPVRLTEDPTPKQDLAGLTHDVLARFVTDGRTPVDPGLVRLIAESIKQKQSDAYIDVLLNTAVARGRAQSPQALRTASGGIDTHALLTALALEAGGNPPIKPAPTTLSGTHLVQAEDSLAGIALRVRGSPSAYIALLQKNADVDARKPTLVEGQTLQIPSD